MIRVLMVEDSPTARLMLAAVLTSDPEITIVGEASSGDQALDLVMKLKPDLITMDLHMPVMDGLAATRAIMAAAPTPIILMTASSVREDVALSFEVLRAGALAITDKPSPSAENTEAEWARLIELVKALADVRVVRHLTPTRPAGAIAAPPRLAARVIGIGASAGGPTAMRDLLVSLPASMTLPILAVQHMAPGFTSGLADWLSAETGSARSVRVAQHGAPLAERTVYLAPDRMHLGVSRLGSILLSDEAPVGGFRPSATYLFASLAAVFGSAVIGVILSGMGTDGLEGLVQVHAAGGVVVAQDRESSLVHGMPGAVIAAGIVDASFAPVGIGRYLAAARVA